MRIPTRLQPLLSWFDSTMVVADIGADHGALSVAIQAKFGQRVYATELSASSIRILQARLEGTPVIAYQANGLDQLPNDVNTVVITGMGGRLIETILERGKASWKQLHTLILGPQSNLPSLRQYLSDHGWKLDKEMLLEAGGKRYAFLFAIVGQETLSPIQCHYGPRLLETKNEVLNRQFHDEMKQLERKQVNHPLTQNEMTRLQWIYQYVKN